MTQPVDDMPQTPEEAAPWLTPVILAAFTVYLAAAAPAVVTGTVVNPAALWPLQPLWERQVDRFFPYLVRMARYGWERAVRELGASTPWDRNDPDLIDILLQSRNLLVRIPDEIYRHIIKIMAVAQDKGETREQIAARVSNYLNITGSENWPNRSTVIARTELNRFDRSGGLASMRSTERRSNRTILKQWKDEDDSRVRKTHAAVDNQLRRLGEPFHVGRSMLQQPIDPRGFPEDVINCRCDLKYRWK